MPTCIAIAVVEHNGEFLIGRRPDDVPLPGLWEFPGGKINPDETAQQAAARECLEETGLLIEVGDEYPPVHYQYSHGELFLRFFRCCPHDPALAPHARFHWVRATDLVNYEFPAANASLVAMLAGSHDQISPKTS
jgi:8-oxo-dGTP diphosphatase